MINGFTRKLIIESDNDILLTNEVKSALKSLKISILAGQCMVVIAFIGLFYNTINGLFETEDYVLLSILLLILLAVFCMMNVDTKQYCRILMSRINAIRRKNYEIQG